jgi:hypothetical protein
MSGGGFQVVLSDLAGMARVFRDESGAFEAIMPADGPSCPDAGGRACLKQRRHRPLLWPAARRPIHQYTHDPAHMTQISGSR